MEPVLGSGAGSWRRSSVARCGVWKCTAGFGGAEVGTKEARRSALS